MAVGFDEHIFTCQVVAAVAAPIACTTRRRWDSIAQRVCAGDSVKLKATFDCRTQECFECNNAAHFMCDTLIHLFARKTECKNRRNKCAMKEKKRKK